MELSSRHFQTKTNSVLGCQACYPSLFSYLITEIWPDGPWRRPRTRHYIQILNLHGRNSPISGYPLTAKSQHWAMVLQAKIQARNLALCMYLSAMTGIIRWHTLQSSVSSTALSDFFLLTSMKVIQGQPEHWTTNLLDQAKFAKPTFLETPYCEPDRNHLC